MDALEEALTKMSELSDRAKATTTAEGMNQLMITVKADLTRAKTIAREQQQLEPVPNQDIRNIITQITALAESVIQDLTARIEQTQQTSEDERRPSQQTGDGIQGAQDHRQQQATHSASTTETDRQTTPQNTFREHQVTAQTQPLSHSSSRFSVGMEGTPHPGNLPVDSLTMLRNLVQNLAEQVGALVNIHVAIL